MRVERDHVAALRAAVRECLQLRFLRAVEEIRVLAEQGKVFVVHEL